MKMPWNSGTLHLMNQWARCVLTNAMDKMQENNRESQTITSVSSQREIHISESNLCCHFRTHHPIIAGYKFRSNTIELSFFFWESTLLVSKVQRISPSEE